ncbi:hypothetical protein QBC39DRAFT_283218 [Podospora conica]|nr:hypothetical protein QBC39DRAFT_283218 [Schizothecium conicum]
MLLPAREVFMMVVMDRLTDRADWDTKVFDDESVALWRSEVLSWPQETFRHTAAFPLESASMLSERVFDFCIAELRCKAEYFNKTGLVFTLNAENNNIIKSDTLVPDAVRHGFKSIFDKLLAEHSIGRSEDPGAPYNGDIVLDPWRHPYRYGKSTVFEDEVVGVEDAVTCWAGEGSTCSSAEEYRDKVEYSWVYQLTHLLPSNVVFGDDGTVKITSYVNNLHPNEHASAYSLLEKLISAAVPAWDHALYGYARVEERIVHQWHKSIRRDDLAQARFDIVRAIGPDDLETGWEPSTPSASGNMGERARRPIHPEPVSAQPVTYGLENSLRSRFGGTGLQVIVKMTSIELTPEMSETAPHDPEWLLDALIAEDEVVATAIYCVESENTVPLSVAFRMRTSRMQPDFRGRVKCGHGSHRYAEEIYGTTFTPKEDSCFQSYGNTVLGQGRLVAYPTGFQYRTSQVSLCDKTKPGRYRFITLWLVDPSVRAISTANVPPQRVDWWAGAVLGAKGSRGVRGEIPPELLQVFLDQLGEALPNALKRLGLSETDLIRLTGHRKYRLPAELVEMIHQHKLIPEGLFFERESSNSDRSEFVWSCYVGLCRLRNQVYDSISWAGNPDEEWR